MSDTESLLPVFHKTNSSYTSKIVKPQKFCSVKISFTNLGLVNVFFSFFSFFFCVIWSITYNFEEANATHCSVENFLPSISAAIGHYYPQIYVWNAMVLSQIIPRLKISNMYYNYYGMIISDKYYRLCKMAWFSHFCELWSLVGLSIITSTTNYTIHAFCFVTFLFSSMFYMIISCYLLKFKRKIPPAHIESRSLKWKFKYCVINILCFILAGYFFRRHNIYCEPWVYSLFAFFEYGVVATNMLFHSTAIWDFYDKTFSFTMSSRLLHIDYEPPFKAILRNGK